MPAAVGVVAPGVEDAVAVVAGTVLLAAAEGSVGAPLPCTVSHPPAKKPRTSLKQEPYVGVHSEASMRPSRPPAPTPMYTTRPLPVGETKWRPPAAVVDAAGAGASRGAGTAEVSAIDADVTRPAMSREQLLYALRTAPSYCNSTSRSNAGSNAAVASCAASAAVLPCRVRGEDAAASTPVNRGLQEGGSPSDPREEAAPSTTGPSRPRDTSTPALHTASNIILVAEPPFMPVEGGVYK